MPQSGPSISRGAVDTVLAWQAESKPKQHLGKLAMHSMSHSYIKRAYMQAYGRRGINSHTLVITDALL